MAWGPCTDPICEASFMTPAYIRSHNEMPRERAPAGPRRPSRKRQRPPTDGALTSGASELLSGRSSGGAWGKRQRRRWIAHRNDLAFVQGWWKRPANWPRSVDLTSFRKSREHPNRDPSVSKSPSSKTASAKSGNIYIGVGGWTFEPWRGAFYPEKLAQAKELQYAASKLTSIEINGTYYGSQKPESFRKWAHEVPNGFVFSVKGPRFATNRRVLAEAGDSVKRFYDSGVLELGDRLGPVLWQFAPTKKFDEADFGKFLELLPRELEGRKLRHVVEVRHDSFCVPAFVALIKKFETPVVFAEHNKYPAIADLAGDFVYARLQKGDDEIKTCYPPKQLDAWAKRLQLWAEGGEPDDLPRVDPSKARKTPRDVFAYVIHEGKIRAPAGAMELIARVS